MEPNFDIPAKFIDDANTNCGADGRDDTITGEHAVAARTFKNVESLFLSKNSSLKALVVLSVGLKNSNGEKLIDLEGDPWKSLQVKTNKPQKEDYVEEISQCCV